MKILITGGYVFDVIAMITGKKFPVSSIRIKKFTATTIVNIDRLLESTFSAPDSLENGLRKMIQSEFL